MDFENHLLWIRHADYKNEYSLVLYTYDDSVLYTKSMNVHIYRYEDGDPWHLQMSDHCPFLIQSGVDRNSIRFDDFYEAIRFAKDEWIEPFFSQFNTSIDIPIKLAKDKFNEHMVVETIITMVEL